MSKRQKIGMLLIALVLSMAMALGSAFAADDDVITTKSLVSTGSMGAGEIEWAEAGAPDAWPGAVEEIRIDGQEDGGDVILRTELAADNVSLVTGQYGFARQSTNAAICAYSMSGLTMKFYAQSAGFMMMFTQNSGWYGASTYHWELWFQSGSVTLRKCTTGGDNMVNAGDAASTLVTDYDYFKDPATIGYKNVGDNAQTFVGTENVLEIKSVGGHACLFLNGTQLFDLTETGVVSDVFNNFNSDGGFLCFYGTNASAQAIKITDIYNVQSSWTEGVPDTYTLLSGGAEYKADESSNVGIRSTAPDYAYAVKYGVKQYVQDISLTFYYAGGELAEGDVLNVKLLDSAENGTAYINFAFAKKTVNSATLTVTAFDGAEKTLGSAEVKLYYNGSALNTIALKETVPFVLSVNGAVADIDLTPLSAMKSAFTDGQISVVYAVEESAAGTLTPVSYTSAPVAEYEAADGFAVEGDGVVIKSDGDYMMFYNEEDSAYSVSYTANKLIANSFELSYRFGKYGEKTEPFTVGAMSGDAGLTFTFAYVDDASAKLSVAIAGGKTLAEETVDFKWSYSDGDKKLGFVKSGVSGYLVFVNGDIAIQMNADDQVSELDAAVEKMEGGMADISFSVGGDALTAFALLDYEYYVPTTLAAGWGEGALPGTRFGYAAGSNTVIAFSNAWSYQKGTGVLVDGFSMQFKTYAKAGYASPTWAISTVSAWYSNNSAIQFMIGKNGDDKATFSLQYTNKVDGDYETIGVGKENEGITSFSVPWNWNNGEYNEISLNLTDGVWRWTVNGTVLTPAEGQVDYSDYYNDLWALYTSSDKTGVVQIYGGANAVYDIASMAEYVPNADPVVNQPDDFSDCKIGDKLALDLTTVFSDANGDELSFVFEESDQYQGKIEGSQWSFDCTDAGTYTVKIYCYDGNGGEAVCEFNVTVTAESGGGSGCDCNSSVAAGSALALLLIGLAVLPLIRRRLRG